MPATAPDRRRLLAGLAALPMLTAGRGPQALERAARAAFIFTLPLLEIARTRQLRHPRQGLNRLIHAQALSDWRSREVTTPNNDTLYSHAQLDLTAGPARLTVPPGRDRYISVALMDAYSNNFAVLGTRTTPDGGGFVVAPPGSRGGEGIIVAPTPHVWGLARTLVSGPEDFAAARAFAERLRLSAPAAPPPMATPPRDAPWPDYLRAASRLMRANPPPAPDAPALAAFSALGLTGAFDPRGFSAAEREAIAAGLEAGRRYVREGMGRKYVQGWAYPNPNLGAFGQDYDYRARVALGGLAALPVEEAMYMFAEGDEAGGRHFRPGQRLRLRLPAERLPPVDAFWSLSIYEATPEGQFFFARNPIDRYAIGDRTPGLRRGGDGSIDIWISHEDPGDDRRPNWLPAPNAPFQMNFRAYLPRAELRDGRYRLPPLERL